MFDVILSEAGSLGNSLLSVRIVVARHWVDRVAQVCPLRKGNSEAIKGAVAAGLGVSILSRLCVEQDLRSGRIVSRPFAEGGLRPTLLQVEFSGDRRSPAAQQVVGIVQGEIPAEH